MAVYGTKRTFASALHMSAFGGKADMPSRDGAKVKSESVRPLSIALTEVLAESSVGPLGGVALPGFALQSKSIPSIPSTNIFWR